MGRRGENTSPRQHCSKPTQTPLGLLHRWQSGQFNARCPRTSVDMWFQTAATTYLLQPWNSAPLRVARRRRSRQNKSGKSVRTRFAADLCSGHTLGSTSFLFASVPLPSGYPPRFYYRKRGHLFNNIPLHWSLSFHLHCMDTLHLISQTSVFFRHCYLLSAQLFPPDTGLKSIGHTQLCFWVRTSILVHLSTSQQSFQRQIYS